MSIIFKSNDWRIDYYYNDWCECYFLRIIHITDFLCFRKTEITYAIKEFKEELPNDVVDFLYRWNKAQVMI